MDLILLILGIALAGFLVHVITAYIPMPPIFRTIIWIVVVVVAVLFLIKMASPLIPNVL